jgi:hypothetical protein
MLWELGYNTTSIYLWDVYVASFIASNLAQRSEVSFECRIVPIGVKTAYPCFN